MSNSNIDYIKPYKNVSQLFKSGLDYIAANCQSSSSSAGPKPASDCDCLDDAEVQNLINCVYTFLDNNYDIIDGELSFEQAIKATLANAVNGYLESGGRDRALVQSLQAVPVPSIGDYFDRMFQNTGASGNLKNHKSSQQLSLEIGKAGFEYWNDQVTKGAAPAAWGQYLTGNEALDTTYIPYWISAAMCGSRFNFFQDNATDSPSVVLTTMLALGGALVVNAGKVMFEWVPKQTLQKHPTHSRPQPAPTSGSTPQSRNLPVWCAYDDGSGGFEIEVHEDDINDIYTWTGVSCHVLYY